MSGVDKKRELLGAYTPTSMEDALIRALEAVLEVKDAHAAEDARDVIKLATTEKPQGHLTGVKYPGAMAMAHERGHYPGVAVKAFSRNDGPIDVQVNDWCQAHREDRPLVVDMKFSGETAVIFFTRTVSDEEQGDLDFVERFYGEKMRALKDARDERIEKARVEKETAKKESARLADVGARYEQRLQAIKKLPSRQERDKAWSDLESGAAHPDANGADEKQISLPLSGASDA